MKVHNVYNDMLLSLGNFLNSIIDNRIKSFQYNISSPSLLLDYNANFELPSAILTYTNTTYLNARPNTFLRHSSNINIIPVLYNVTKDISLSVQEDHFQVSIDAIINFDSQLEAINYRHQIENLLPLNKYLQAYQFTSFYPIDNRYLNTYLFDPINDHILNLYSNHDKLNDRINYSFALSYYPLIKLISNTVNVSEVTSSSYSWSLSFELLIQLPSRLFFNFANKNQKNVAYNDVKYLKYSDIQVPCQKINFKYLDMYLREQDINEINYFKIYCPCDIIDNTNQAIGRYKNNDIEIDAEVTIQSETKIAIISKLIYSNDIFKDIVLNIKHGEISDYGVLGSFENINGKISNIKYNDNLISFTFQGEVNNVKVNSIFKDLEFYFIDTVYNIGVPKISITSNSNKEISILDYKFVDSGNIFSIIKSINKYRNEINYMFTIIKSIIFYDVEHDIFTDIILLPIPVSIDSQGYFNFEINNILISGYLDLKTTSVKIIDVTDVNLNKITSVEVHSLIFDIVFNNYPIRGPGNIEEITINLGADIQPIFMGSSFTPTKSDRRNFNLIIDKPDIIEKDSTNRYGIKIPIQGIIDIPKEFLFLFNSTNYITTQNKLDLILDLETSTISNLIFTFNEEFYFNHMIKVNSSTPLLFSTPLAEVI